MDFLMAAWAGLQVHWSWGKESVPSIKGGTQDHSRAITGCAGESSVTALPENMVRQGQVSDQH